MTRDKVDHIIVFNLLALGFDFEEDLDGFQILVRYNARAHSGSCSIRNFRSVPFSGHCGECRRPLRHTEARSNDHLFREIIFKKNHIYSTTQTQTLWSFYEKNHLILQKNLYPVPWYIYYLVPFDRTFISGTNMSWEKCKYLAEHKYRIKCTLHTQNTPSPKFQIASKYCTHTSFRPFFSSHTNNFFSQTCVKSACNTNVNMIKKFPHKNIFRCKLFP